MDNLARSRAAWAPDVFDYLEPVAFLKDLRHAAERSGRAAAYSIQAMAGWAGYRARSHMHSILSDSADRQRSLPLDRAEDLAHHIFARTIPSPARQLVAKRYFVDLVRYCQLDGDEAFRLQRRLLADRREHRIALHRPTDDAALRYVGSWYANPIRQLALRPGFEPDASEVCAALWPTVDEAEVAELLSWMCQSGELTPTEDGWRPERASVVFPREAADIPGYREHWRDALCQTYRDAHRVATESIGAVPSKERLLGLKFINLSSAAFLRLRSRLEVLLQSLEDDVQGEVGTVYQVAVSLVPLTHPEGG